jgi:hypothetical protein
MASFGESGNKSDRVIPGAMLRRRLSANNVVKRPSPSHPLGQPSTYYGDQGRPTERL